MARPLRVEFDGALYHVTSRGNARRDIFDEDGDRKAFLEILGKDARIVQAVHHYGDSQREVADFLDLHYARVSGLGCRLRYKKQDLTPFLPLPFSDPSSGSGPVPKVRPSVSTGTVTSMCTTR